MGDWVPELTMIGLALIIGTTVVLRGPVGRALAQWIASWSTPEHKAMEAQWAKVAAAQAPGGRGAAIAEVLELQDAVEDLRRQLAEVQERLDFTERMLAQRRDAERLASPSR